MECSSTLFIDGLGATATEATVYKMFAAVDATIERALLPRSEDSPAALGYGWVELSSPMQAAKAMQQIRRAQRKIYSLNVQQDLATVRVWSCWPPLYLF